jgi:hypothetical protein
MDITISTLRKDAFKLAEDYYQRYFNDDHERIDPEDDWDESKFVSYARLWLVALKTYDRMNEWLPDDHREYHEQLMYAYTADFDECLVSMYG